MNFLLSSIGGAGHLYVGVDFNFSLPQGLRAVVEPDLVIM
jgi:hypothetical protein